ncbi:MAG: hypothetical protein QOG53_3587 [Frankiales bacterium]|jgi:hypothetical protein|nr:hypothetical protein [Frankiales bacterium]
MRLELKRSGGFTGNTLRWQLEPADEGDWRALIDRSRLRFRAPGLGIARLLLGNPFGGSHPDYVYVLSVDGRRASFRGVDVSGAVAELVERITREGEEIGSR